MDRPYCSFFFKPITMKLSFVQQTLLMKAYKKRLSFFAGDAKEMYLIVSTGRYGDTAQSTINSLIEKDLLESYAHTAPNTRRIKLTSLGIKKAELLWQPEKT